MKFGLHRYTVDAFFEKVVKEYGDELSVGSLDTPPISYREMGRVVESIQQLLLRHGVGKASRVAIVGISTPNWAMAYLAVMALGAVAVPIMEDFPPADIRHLMEFGEADAALLSRQVINTLGEYDFSRFRVLVCMDDLEVVCSSGAAPALREEVREDDLAEILFTSGTMGFSKGVMLTHRNLVSNIFEGPDILQCIDRDSVALNILPMAHAFGSTSAFLSIIYCGSELYFLGRKPTVGALMQAFGRIRPTILGGVPLIFEKIYSKKVAPLIAGKPLFRTLARFSWSRRVLFRIIGRKFNVAFGGRLECAIIGGAPLSEEVESFLRVARIPFAIGYGMTEAAPLITFQSREASRRGSVGWAINDLEISIEDPEPDTGIGEILVRGPNVMAGYLKDPQATAEILSAEGWLRTGDRGFLDDDGYLFLRGRSKNVIVGPSGENIYPEVIESLIAASPYVEEVLVYAGNSGIVGRVFPNREYLDIREKLGTHTGWLEGIRREVNAKLPIAARVVNLIEEHVPFIKTASNKIKRSENIRRE